MLPTHRPFFELQGCSPWKSVGGVIGNDVVHEIKLSALFTDYLLTHQPGAAAEGSLQLVKGIGWLLFSLLK